MKNIKEFINPDVRFVFTDIDDIIATATDIVDGKVRGRVAVDMTTL